MEEQERRLRGQPFSRFSLVFSSPAPTCLPSPSSHPQAYSSYPSQFYPSHQAQTQQQLQQIYYQSSHHHVQLQPFSPPPTPSHYQPNYASSPPSSTQYTPPTSLPSFNATFGYTGIGRGAETRSGSEGGDASSSSRLQQQRGGGGSGTTSWAWGLRPVGEEWREEEGRD